MSVQQREIPKYVDEPIHFLLWSADEVAPIGLAMVVGIFADAFGKSVLAGFVLSSIYKKYKESTPNGFAFHWLYWHGLMPAKSKLAPNSFIRRFFP